MANLFCHEDSEYTNLIRMDLLERLMIGSNVDVLGKTVYYVVLVFTP